MFLLADAFRVFSHEELWGVCFWAVVEKEKGGKALILELGVTRSYQIYEWMNKVSVLWQLLVHFLYDKKTTNLIRLGNNSSIQVVDWSKRMVIFPFNEDCGPTLEQKRMIRI
jgi:hypothetical protein